MSVAMTFERTETRETRFTGRLTKDQIAEILETFLLVNVLKLAPSPNVTVRLDDEDGDLLFTITVDHDHWLKRLEAPIVLTEPAC